MEFKPTNQSFDNEYPKLVRDNIPEMIFKRSGKTAKVQIADQDKEYLKYLFRKMVEEAKELEYSIQVGNTQEELADILEIVNAILELKGIKIEEIIKLQKEKRDKNGGFKNRIILLEK